MFRNDDWDGGDARFSFFPIFFGLCVGIVTSAITDQAFARNFLFGQPFDLVDRLAWLLIFLLIALPPALAVGWFFAGQHRGIGLGFWVGQLVRLGVMYKGLSVHQGRAAVMIMFLIPMLGGFPAAATSLAAHWWWDRQSRARAGMKQ